MTSYDDCTLYAGPAQIAGRGDSDSSGVWVKFTLPPEIGERAHPFRGFQGNQVQLAVVLCDDNGEPRKVQIGPDKGSSPPVAPDGAPQGQGKVRHFKDMDKSQQAAIMCRDEEFGVWFGEKYPKLFDTHYFKRPDTMTHEAVADAVRDLLAIQSRKELDTDPAKAKAWDSLLADFEYRDSLR